MSDELSESHILAVRRLHGHILQLVDILHVSYADACLLHMVANIHALAHDSGKNASEYQANLERTRVFMERFTAWMDHQEIDRLAE